MLCPMTYARSIPIPPGSPGTFHCVSRCVRRAFLCGEDRLTGRSFEHRRQWVEDRIHELAGIFGVAIWGYAVMSNHLHVVVQTLPEAVARWSDDEVAERWMRSYPRQDQNPEMLTEVLAGNAERIKELRQRLSNLSWFMRCLVAPKSGDTRKLPADGLRRQPATRRRCPAAPPGVPVPATSFTPCLSAGPKTRTRT